MTVKYRLLAILSNHILYPSIQRVLSVIFLLSLAVSVYFLLSPYPGMVRLIEKKAPSKENISLAIIKQSFETIPPQAYLQNVSRRDIFGNPFIAYKAGQSKAKPVIDGFLGDLKLIGVLMGDNPRAVIENRKTKEIYYLHRGDYAGSFRIIEINNNSVILDIGGQNSELRL